MPRSIKAGTAQIASDNKRAGGPVYITQAGTAWLYRRKFRTVEKWFKDHSAPGRVEGKGYNLLDVAEWLRTTRGLVPGGVRVPPSPAGSPAPSPGLVESEAELRRRKLRLECELNQERLDRERGAKIDLAVAEEKVTAALRWMVDTMERAGSELASRIPGKRPSVVRKLVADHFAAVRNEALKRMKRTPKR
jgi:hypothetical protein